MPIDEELTPETIAARKRKLAATRLRHRAEGHEQTINGDAPSAQTNGEAEQCAMKIVPLDQDYRRDASSATIMLDAETLEMETIAWLWKHWLALGKLHLIAGAPEAGKTTIALALAATVSAGAYWPDGTRAPAGNVLIWTSEDGLADTIKPRLVRMGADLSRIKFVFQQRDPDGKTRPFNPSIDMPSLTAAAAAIKSGVALLIVDPIVSAIGSKTNSHNNAETRNSLQPVVDFGEASHCALCPRFITRAGSASIWRPFHASSRPTRRHASCLPSRRRRPKFSQMRHSALPGQRAGHGAAFSRCAPMAESWPAENGTRFPENERVLPDLSARKCWSLAIPLLE